ncbi:hypothetical protein BDR06DRAFT_985440 [Suillus hirtellus]|nr:hypothetical protein BDR06DRAFT_985440 [Suillus hirtellus]
MKSREDQAVPFSVPGFHFHPLTQCIPDELYTSDSWLNAQDELQKLSKEPRCSLEQAWPLYMYFGNLTKYARATPKSSTCHLVGFLPSVFHACWDTLLDTDFLHSYHHGIVLKCADGVFHRIFPCIFTYSTDYPEKVLIATMKDMGLCPCPHCLVLKSMFGSLGLIKDMRSHISSVRVYIEINIVPVVNKFIKKLGGLDLDLFHMLIMDFMHECKLGTWEALFTHLIRILYALPGGLQLVVTLDSR